VSGVARHASDRVLGDPLQIAGQILDRDRAPPGAEIFQVEGRESQSSSCPRHVLQASVMLPRRRRDVRETAEVRLEGSHDSHSPCRKPLTHSPLTIGYPSCRALGVFGAPPQSAAGTRPCSGVRMLAEANCHGPSSELVARWRVTAHRRHRLLAVVSHLSRLSGAFLGHGCCSYP